MSQISGNNIIYYKIYVTNTFLEFTDYIDIETGVLSGKQASTSHNFITGVQEDFITGSKEDVVRVIQVESTKPVSPTFKNAQSTLKTKKLCLTETKKKSINKISASIIKSKNQKNK